ncbi:MULTISPECIES: hypothetical protein [unclassified Pseudoalteromonas]|uniref:hypothetical protein n=1 Tax=unclassified Pseudoalteromonas TaxID=194690 RepID=UPI0025B56A99|nr:MULTISPECIES: hypothetical protein [unclassified Pseudoalteromonas]MDN3431425.1 hypothetical protein [Pseudoalteromonas sp. APC 3907]MDN3463787.1 hypothetical protein [Pseudoalteromonas sp. APC 3495]
MERYAYLDTWDKLQTDEFKSVFNYALNLAKNNQSNLTLVVNNVSQCSDFIEKFLNQVQVNKLAKGNVLKFQGVEVSLKSPFSIKNYNNYGVLCAFHPSDTSLQSMESTTEPQAIVILGEQEPHLHAWLKEHSGKVLRKE